MRGPTDTKEWLAWKAAREETIARNIARSRGDESRWQEHSVIAMCQFWHEQFPARFVNISPYP